MSNQTEPTSEWGQPAAPQPPKRKRQFTITKIAIGVAAGIALFIVLAVVLVAIAVSGSSTDKKTTTAATVATTTATTTAQSAPAATTYSSPRLDDFQMRVKVLSKECFGEAGCNITYRVSVGWAPTYDPSKTYELTYQVRGGEDVQVFTTEIQGDQYTEPIEEIASTTSSSKKLTAVPTAIEATS